MVTKREKFGMIKTLLDAHTMGIHAASSLLIDCGYKVIIAPKYIEEAVEKIQSESNQELIIKWIKDNKINHIGMSYRLDPDDGVNLFGRLVALLKREGIFESEGAIVRSVFFAGLKPACERIEKEYEGRIRTFKGGESAEETLLTMGVPEGDIPRSIIEGCQYDKKLLKFGEEVVKDGKYFEYKPLIPNVYPEYGTKQDSLVKRLDANFKSGYKPLIRAHLGPYSTNMTRRECIENFAIWCKQLADTSYLDILSIGSSQLSQSNFGEDWSGKPNGGGVPINSEEEYHKIWTAANPMLVRTYSSTKNIVHMAEVYERSINMAWHAFSLWWFNELDGRGTNGLYENLKEHIDAINYIAKVGKPVETNVPHHFAFRGCDDVTYIVSAYIAAKTAKKCGVRTFILQNMLNTPRSTWGVQDIAKSRVLLKLVNGMKDSDFRVIFQTRAGLDYFKPDIEQAKIQLAAVSAMMDDIDYYNEFSPEVIHVVSFSEALFLANPLVLNESIKITRFSLEAYRRLKRNGYESEANSVDVLSRMERLEKSAIEIIRAMEETIPNLYTPEGLYLAFVSGWFPVPELWSDSEEFMRAKKWETKMLNGGVALVENGLIMSTETRINRCVSGLLDANYMLKQKINNGGK